MKPSKETRREFIKAAGGGLIAAGACASCSMGAGGRRKAGISKGGTASPPPMPMRELGRTGISVSFLGFAVFHWREAALYRRAVDLGITYFHSVVDSNTRKRLAPNEYNLDAFAALRPFRDRLVISHMTVNRSSKAELRKDLDEYLRLSRFGHLDVWYICCPSPAHLEDFAEVLAEARKAGKVRASALSSHRLDEDIPRIIAPDSPIDVVMMTYNFTASPDDKKRLATLHTAGKGIVAMKPMAGRFYRKPGDRPEPVIRWLASDPRVHTIPVGMETVEEVEQNVAALRQPFSDEDREALKRQLAYTSPRFCRMCGACDGRCPRGLAVSDLVRVAMYAEGYGNADLARGQRASIPAAQRRASCDDCERCAVRCPNGVAIRDRLRLAQTMQA